MVGPTGSLNYLLLFKELVVDVLGTSIFFILWDVDNYALLL